MQADQRPCVRLTKDDICSEAQIYCNRPIKNGGKPFTEGMRRLEDCQYVKREE